MKRLLVLVMAVILCAAGAGLAAAAVVPNPHNSSAIPAVSAALRPAALQPAAPITTAVSTGDRLTTAAAVQQAMQAVVPTIQTGLEVFDRQTGTVLTSENANQQSPSMSVVKLLIALDVLTGHNGVTPDSEMQQELHQMLADSDDEIADQLWTADGGPAIVTRMAGLLGLTGTRPPDDPGEWGDTEITPQDVVTVYRYITDRLPEPDRDLVIGALASAPQIAADGTDQYFGIPSGMPHTTWAIKQGWGTSGSRAAFNTTGLVGTDSRYVVVVLACAPASAYSTVPAAVTAGTRVLAGLVGPAPV